MQKPTKTTKKVDLMEEENRKLGRMKSLRESKL
jgi:hypothetical protein